MGINCRRLLIVVCLLTVSSAGCARRPQTQTGGLELKVGGKLTVGSDIPFEPFEFEKDGELTGFDVELVREIAARLDLTAEFVDTDFDTIFTQLAAGNFDVVASATTITEERQKQVDFTIPYYLSQQALTVNSEKTPNITSTADLKSGDTVAVQEGTTGKQWAEDNLAAGGIQIRSFRDAPDTYIALEAGNVTAVIFDEPSAISAAKERTRLKVVETIDTGESFGFGVNPRAQGLLDAVNRVLQEIIDDGTYDRIYATFDLPPGGRITAGVD